MDLSPRSTVSSDLYSSEPAKPEEHPPPEPKEQFANEDLQPLSEVARDGTEESGYLDTMEGLDSPFDQASRSSSAPISNGIPEISHKRKREQDGDAENKMQEDSLSNSQMNRIPFRSRTNSQISIDQPPSHRQSGPSMSDRARIKRSKTSDQNSGSDIAAQLFSKSSALPAVLWQHILCYVPPVFLGRLLRVNHAFNTYLTPGKAGEDTRVLPKSVIQPLKAEDIWLASRRRFAPGLPRPMHGLQDLDMWRLLRGQNCQICGQAKETIPAANLDSPCESGPGNSSVQIIWPFGVRCCGSCLQDVSKKEMDLFLSTDCPSFLLQAIPFAFVSEANHYIAHSFLRNTTAPPTLPLTKRYYKPHIEEIKRQFEGAKELGTASAEEWIKGLARQGQERLEDLIRWEQWESRGGLKKVNTRPQPKVSTHVGNRTAKAESHSDRSTPQSMIFSSRLEGGQASPAPFTSIGLAQFGPGASTPPYQTSWTSVAPHPTGTQPGSQVPFCQTRPERNIRDVNEAKASRRAEIERRCADLDPPLMPNVLNHMESFQAATQITQPLTEPAWQILKPRLLAQLPYAERREKERVQQTEVLAEEYRQRRHQEAQLKETKDNFDREWETFQTPVRNRIGALADDVIETRWAGAKSITKHTSPKFAADVLVNVRQRFYAEIAQEDEAALAAGEPVKTDSPNGPPTRKLILENMKWLFDTKIKPLTDYFQRELFLCNGCDGNFKFYGFEGVIQHYAAKHTTTLSMGNIVVHWRAEWPEHPPFNPNPSVAKAAYYKVPTPAPIQTHSVREPQPHGPTNFGNYGQAAETGAPALPQRNNDNGQYTPNGYSTSYAGLHPEGPSQAFPAQNHPAANPAYTLGTGYTGYSGYSGPPNGYASSAAHYTPYPNAPQVAAPHGYGSSITPQSPYPAFTQTQSCTNSQLYIPGPNANSFTGGPYPPNISNGYLPNHVPNVPGPVSDLYQRQMDEMAKHAKDVFTGIGGVKDLPGSVRIYVVIQHTVSRFKAAFPNEPSLSMFIDGLDHNPVMRPVRSVNGLGCKTCIKFGTSAKLFTLPHLVNHFRTTHVEAPQALGYSQVAELDWKHDMIDLPELSVISNLVNAPGMTDHKLSLIAWAFPEALPTPLPSLRGRMNTGPLPVFRKELDNITRAAPIAASSSMTDLSSHFEFQSNIQPHIHPESGYRQPSQGPSSEPLEPPGEDEYDPHQPLLSKIVKIESGHGQSQNPARPSTLQNGHRSSFQVRHESPQYANRTHDELPYDNTGTSRIKHSEHYADRPFERTELMGMPYSPRQDVFSRSGNRLGLRAGDQNMPQLHENREEGGVSMECGSKYRRTPEDGKSSESWRSSKHRQRSLSPLGAADPAEHFLSNIAPKQGSRLTHDIYTSDRDVALRSEAPWLDEPHPKRRQKHFGEDGNYDQGPGEGLNGGGQGSDVHIDHTRAGPLEPRNADETITQQRPGSRSRYYDDYRLASHIQIPLRSIRAEDSPPVRYAPYEPTQPAIIHERQELNGSALKRSRSGTHPHKSTRIQSYSEGPESPQNSPVETALYRPRSPVEEDRGDGVYLRSPPLRRQSRPQRVVSYDYQPQTRIEYVDDRGVPESRYQPRVEYIRYEEPGPREPTRYVVARPVEQMQPEYVRYEQTYADKPVYERSGQLYHHAPQKFYRQ